MERTAAVMRMIGGLLAYATLGFVFFGIWRGTQRQPGRTSGIFGSWLRSSWFYLLSSALFFGLSYWGWTPLPLSLTPLVRVWMLALGCLFNFPGILLVLWGRLALRENYFVSTGMGAQLFAGHELVTGGPFAIIRHPMYSGLILAALGSFLLYTTWTSLFYALFSPFIILRAYREEMTLAAEFGEQWQEYSNRVPAFVPRLKRK